LKTGENGNGNGEASATPGESVLGNDPDTGLAVMLKSGRFGPYIQLGDGEKPKRASIPRGIDPGSISLDYALTLPALPREAGVHPETGKAIMAGFGRYGPYIEHEGKYVKIEAGEVLTIGLNRAVALFADAAAQGKGNAARTSAPIKVLGEHPALGGKVEVL